MNDTAYGADARMQATARAAGAVVMLIGVLVLIGWTFDIPVLKSGAPDWAAMNPLTAVAALLGGAVLQLRQFPAAGPRARLATLAGATAIAATGFVVLMRDTAGIDLGLDHFLFRDRVALAYGGGMAGATALSLLLLGSALLLAPAQRRAPRTVAQVLALACLSLCVLAVLGYLYDAADLYKLALYNAFALYAALALAALSIGVLATCGSRGWLTLFASPRQGGVLLRQLWMPAVFIIAALGWLRLQGEQAGLLDTEFGIALSIFLSLAVFTILNWHAARRLDESDIGRRMAEASQRIHYALEQLLRELAECVNHAVTPEEAMRECLVRICRHGGWVLGRVAITDENGMQMLPERSFWHSVAAGRHADFMRASGDLRYFGTGGRFISIVRREQRPVWVTDLAEGGNPAGRSPVAVQAGLRSAFAFPVVIQGRTVALLEFFADRQREPDLLLMESIESVSSQLARVIERARATAERERHHAELEHRVEQRTIELVAANRELESFSYSVSHDLRAPLRAIDGFTRLLLEKHGSGLNAEAQRYLDRVRANAQQMGALIDDLLAFSRLGRQPMAPQPVDMRGLVRQCLEALQAEAGIRQTAIEIGDLPDCRGDPGLLRQVWMNLLSNAFKFSAQRATPRVGVGSRAADSGERIYFVRDNGAGFDMRYADKLFGVFQRLHAAKDFPGTGVGLALAQRIVHRHGGRIRAEARPNEGAAFHFTLGGTDAQH